MRTPFGCVTAGFTGMVDGCWWKAAGGRYDGAVVMLRLPFQERRGSKSPTYSISGSCRLSFWRLQGGPVRPGPRMNGAFDSPVNTEGAFDYSVLRADYADAMLSNSCGISASVIPAMLMLPLKK